jgi:hypothetical protein
VLPVNSRWLKERVLNVASTSGLPSTTATSSGGKTCPSILRTVSLVRGVSSDGFSIARLPAASVAASGMIVRENG